MGRRNRRREEIIGIDLGTKTTKAVLVRRKGEVYTLLNYVLVEAPSAEKAFSRSVWADHVRKVGKALGSTSRRVVLAMGPGSTIFTQAELPAASPSDLRKIIKLSPKNYLQQDLPDHVFDCYVTAGDDREGVGRARRKARVLVAAARRPLIEDLVDGAWDAGYTVERITLSQVATADAFAAANPEEAPSETVAFLDIGFRQSTISITYRGRLSLVRVVNIGAEQLADVMHQASTRGPVGMVQEDDENPGLDALQVSVQKAIRGLAKEVDASIGFFLSQYDFPVRQVYVSGGSARSHLILQTLELELGVPCRAWNPALALKHEGEAASRGGDLEYEAPQLTVAVGAALGLLNSEVEGINLLAERAEEEAWRRRDPVRRTRMLVGLVIFGMLAWSGWLGWQAWRAETSAREATEKLRQLQEGPGLPLMDSQVATDLDRLASKLHSHVTQRFLVADVLNALQFIDVPEIQFHRFEFERVTNRTEPPRRRARRGEGDEPEEPTRVTEYFVVRIQGKNYGDESRIGMLFSALESDEQFGRWLDGSYPILLQEMAGWQVDPANPTRSFSRFGIECRFKQREFVYE